jgi:hypothetical protein
MTLPDWLRDNPDVHGQDDPLPESLAREGEDEVPDDEAEAPEDAE